MNGSDQVVLIGLACKESVFVEELDVVDGQFKVSGVVSGQSSQQVELCESS